MMKRQAAIAVLAAVATVGSLEAAGPYRVYRVGSADAALSAPAPLFTVLSSGTVMDPSLGDGNSYYYFVRDGSGASLDLSMGADPVAGTVAITFQGTGTLHDDAIASAQDLFGPAGLLATMAGLVPGTHLADLLEDARLNGVNALVDFIVGTPERDDNAVKTWLDFALRVLADVKADPAPFTVAQVEAIEDRIVEIARAIVTYRLELAINQCGPCSGASGTPVCQAEKRVSDANELRLSGADPSKVVDAYGASINFSLQAMESCF